MNGELPAFEGYPPPPIDLVGIQLAAPFLRRVAELMSGRFACRVLFLVELYVEVNAFLKIFLIFF
jgi:hypothetical protein